MEIRENQRVKTWSVKKKKAMREVEKKKKRGRIFLQMRDFRIWVVGSYLRKLLKKETETKQKGKSKVQGREVVGYSYVI